MIASSLSCSCSLLVLLLLATRNTDDHIGSLQTSLLGSLILIRRFSGGIQVELEEGTHERLIVLQLQFNCKYIVHSLVRNVFMLKSFKDRYWNVLHVASNS